MQNVLDNLLRFRRSLRNRFKKDDGYKPTPDGFTIDSEEIDSKKEEIFNWAKEEGFTFDKRGNYVGINQLGIELKITPFVEDIEEGDSYREIGLWVTISNYEVEKNISLEDKNKYYF